MDVEMETDINKMLESINVKDWKKWKTTKMILCSDCHDTKEVESFENISPWQQFNTNNEEYILCDGCIDAIIIGYLENTYEGKENE